MSKECKTHFCMYSRKCNFMHPTVLHIDLKVKITRQQEVTFSIGLENPLNSLRDLLWPYGSFVHCP